MFSCFIYTPFGGVLLTDLLLEVVQEHSLRGVDVPTSHNWLCCCQSLNCNLTSALHEDAAGKTKMCDMNQKCFQSLQFRWECVSVGGGHPRSPGSWTVHWCITRPRSNGPALFGLSKLLILKVFDGHTRFKRAFAQNVPKSSH